MIARTTCIDFLLREWLLVSSGAGLVLTSLYTHHLPGYSLQEVEVLFLLFVLFIAVKGLQRSGLILKISRKMETGRAVPVQLVMATFFLSMVVTNDIALVVIVPLTLSLQIDKKDLLVILEALAANSGSALTPFGNPQNLFIYWFYDVAPLTFIQTIAPFSLVFFLILISISLRVKTTNKIRETDVQPVKPTAWVHGLFLVLVLLTVLHVLPIYTGLVVIVFALFRDRKALLVDYSLLFSFLFFFGIAENIKLILDAELRHSGHIFLFSALASQVMSNVPATLLFAKFTSNWQALLWGTNAGGFGSLFGSLANLIAYKMYISDAQTTKNARFTAKFLVMGYVALFLSMGLYFLLYPSARP